MSSLSITFERFCYEEFDVLIELASTNEEIDRIRIDGRESEEGITKHIDAINIFLEFTHFVLENREFLTFGRL